jgi:hypothetical protein
VSVFKARLIVVIALLFTVHAATASMQSRGHGVMSGELRGHTGEKVDGGTVKMMAKSGDPLQTTSNKDGRWTISGLGKGEWTMLVTAPGYSARVIRVVIERESTNGEPVVTVLRKMAVAPRN